LANFWRSVGRSIRLVGMFAVASAELAVKRPATREARAEWLHGFCARSMRGMGVGLKVVGQFPERGVIIANHLGYLDIVAFAALRRCVFVSKAEIARWPVLGWMTTMAGTVYVERGRGGSAVKARGGMRAAAAAGLPVVFFPEGTTSNGEAVLKFHSGLLAQAMDAGEAIWPAFVTYRLTQPNVPEMNVADKVCYWGDTPMLGHIFTLLGLHGIEVEVRFGEAPIQFSCEDIHRKTAAVEARAAVLQVGEAERLHR
jgi:1-acyl-sn-glycerol-3-phosphate acyltransferase